MKIIKYKNNISELNKIFERSSEVYKLVIPFVEDIIQEVKKEEMTRFLNLQKDLMV